MAELQTLARPYDRAAFSVARDAQSLPQWGDALTRLAEAASNDDMAALIGHPGVGSEQLLEMLQQLSGAPGDASLGNLLKVLAENRRLALLPAIAEEFSALREAYEHLRNVRIASASELGEAQQSGIVDALKQRLGDDVQVQWAVDADLIGGAVVSAGDLVIDGSVRGEMSRLRSALTQ